MGQATVRHRHRATVHHGTRRQERERLPATASQRPWAKVTEFGSWGKGYVPWHIIGYLEAWDFLGYHGKEAARYQATRLQPNDCDTCDIIVMRKNTG